jgi:hypothetical protein
MATFTVHLPPEGIAAPERIVFLREGFSTPALLFGPFWLLWKRAWIAALGWTLLLGVIAAFGYAFKIESDAMSLVGLAAAVTLGFEGERLLAWSLQRRGFVESDVVIGDSIEEAEEVWFGRLRASQTQTLPAETGA